MKTCNTLFIAFLLVSLDTLAQPPVPTQAPEPQGQTSEQRETKAQVICGLIHGEFPTAERLELDSEAVGRELCYIVFPPPKDAVKPKEGFPLLVLLHGLHGGPGDWLRFPKILDRIQDAQKDSSIGFPHVYVVLPLGKNGYWTNWNRSPQRWRDWVTHEVLKDLHTRYPDVTQIPEKRAIAGYSMGGFGALSIALEYPGFFNQAIGLSPTDMDLAIQKKNQQRVYRRVFGKELPLDRIHQYNPVHQVQRGLGKGQRFFVAFGSNEAPKFSEGTRRLTRELESRKIEVTSIEVRGGTHSFKSTWNKEVMESWLRWLSATWKQTRQEVRPGSSGTDPKPEKTEKPTPPVKESSEEKPVNEGE